MGKADFLDENLSGHNDVSDADHLLAAPFTGAHPHVGAGRIEECADTEEAYGQDGQEILEKPDFDDLKCREHPAEDHEDDEEDDDGEDHEEGEVDDSADDDVNDSYESAPYEDDVEERIA